MTRNKKFLPFALPSIGEEEIAEVADSMRSGWLTTGPKTRKFEQDFSDVTGRAHAIAVNSGTAGLHLALEAIGIGPGDRVITTPYTFTATAEVIRYLGADPVFADIDPLTFNIDPKEVEIRLESSRAVKAIIPVHFGGQACDMDSILDLAGQFGIKVVDDAAHAFPATYRGKMIGSMCDLTVFSFYVTKTIATGEGGMVCTDDPGFANRIRTMRLHGINRDIFDRYTSDKPSWYYEVVAPGFKYNMTDIAAAIGIHQLKKASAFRERRRQIAAHYTEEFSDLPLRTPFVARPEDTHSWHLYVIQLELEALKIDRDRFIELMAESGIGTGVHFIPLHLHPYWRETYSLESGDFPVADRTYRRAVSLPIYPRMSDDDVGRVVAAAKKIFNGFRR